MQLEQHSPVLVVLGTDQDKRLDWLIAGQAMQKVLLRATAHGVAASYLNQPIELDELRPRLIEVLGRSGYPHLILRLGYGAEVRPTPRRSVGDVLIPEA
jgi:hypothetical protein